MLIQLWRTPQLGIGVYRPTHGAYCQISAAQASRRPTKSSQTQPAPFLPRTRCGSQLTGHWSSPETDFITAFTSSPTLRRLPPPPPRPRRRCPVLRRLSRYNDRSTTCPWTVSSVRPVDWWQLTTTGRRSLIHIFGTWLSSSTTCNPIIQRAPRLLARICERECRHFVHCTNTIQRHEQIFV